MGKHPDELFPLFENLDRLLSTAAISAPTDRNRDGPDIAVRLRLPITIVLDGMIGVPGESEPKLASTQLSVLDVGHDL